MRIPDDDYKRDIINISDEEIALAMKTIIKSSYGIMKNELFSVISREFGFGQLGHKIKVSLEKVYNKLLKNEGIIEKEGKLKCESFGISEFIAQL